MSVLAPTDLRRPPDLPPESAGFGTVAEKRLSSSVTSNSGALEQKKQTPLVEIGTILKWNKQTNKQQMEREC